MLGEIRATVGFFEVTAKPISFWHRLFYGLLIYIQGTRVKFELTLTALADIEHESNLLYTIEDSFGHKNPPAQIQQLPMKKGQKHTWQTVDMPLYYSGDSFLIVKDIDDREQPPQTVYVFHATSRNTIFLTGVTLLIAVVIAIATLAFRCPLKLSY